MKYRLSCIAAACLALELTAGAVAYAEDARFTGPSVAVGLGVSRNQIDWSDTWATSSEKKTTAVGRLDLSYGLGIAPQTVLTLGASYDLNKSNFGNYSFVEDDGVTTHTGQTKMKRHFSLYVAPGYQFAPNWLGYAKFAWHNAKFEYSEAGENDQITHNGFGFGLGASTVIAPNVEMRFEVQQVLFRRKSEGDGAVSARPKSTEAVVYLGYRF